MGGWEVGGDERSVFAKKGPIPILPHSLTLLFRAALHRFGEGDELLHHRDVALLYKRQ